MLIQCRKLAGCRGTLYKGWLACMADGLYYDVSRRRIPFDVSGKGRQPSALYKPKETSRWRAGFALKVSTHTGKIWQRMQASTSSVDAQVVTVQDMRLHGEDLQSAVRKASRHGWVELTF